MCRGRFEITGLSVSSYVLQLSRGDIEYTAVPVFLSRAFRHSGFYVRAGSGINDVAQLAGRSVGVPECQMTAGAVWMRGILADEHAVATKSIHWCTGALNAGIRRERLALDLPDESVVIPIDHGETLAARSKAMARLGDVWFGSANMLTMPWLGAMMEATVEAMGPDYWSYGFAGNRDELATICRYSADQCLLERWLAPRSCSVRPCLRHDA